MSDQYGDEVLAQVAEMFRNGYKYKEIADQLHLPHSLVASCLCSAGLFRDQLMARRIVMNQMAADGVYVEDIASTVGLKVDTVKNHLRRSRIKYLLKPQGDK